MSNYDWYDREDGWNADNWSCSCGEPLSSSVYGPGARICWKCRNPAAVEPPAQRRCSKCGVPIKLPIVVGRSGMVCMPCAEPFLELQRKRALAQGEREHARIMERVFRGSRVAAMREE